MPNLKSTISSGQLDVLQKELFFTGDVLNTRVRIQSTCGQYKTDSLITNELLALLDLNNTCKIIPSDEYKLKDRNEKNRTLYT